MDSSNEYITVYLNDIRKEMQCPICLGIIRKTRTVMECLHRFCRECIDKSMRLGNNECPACRTHCASRRSLRDDPNFDSLIAALYQDIDKYEEEEMALLEEETWRNKQIQANIAETFRRQSEALAKRRTAKATAAAIVRKAHGKFRTVQSRSKSRSGGRRRSSRQRESTPEEDESDYYEKEIEPPVEPRRSSTRKRQKPATLDSSASVSMESDNSENDEDMAAVVEDMSRSPEGTKEESDEASPARAGNGGETVVTWARAGTRSHTRYGSLSGGNSRHLRCMRATVLLESLAAAAQKENEDEFDVHFTLHPANETSTSEEEILPKLERPYLCCSPKVSMQQLCSFLIRHDLVPLETELEIVAERVVENGRDKYSKSKSSAHHKVEVAKKVLDVLDGNATLGDVYVNYWNRGTHLSLLYRKKSVQQL